MSSRLFRFSVLAMLIAVALVVMSGLVFSAVPAPLKLEKPFADKPVLLTSAGQSADVHMLYVAAGKVGLECINEPLIEAKDIDVKKYRTIVFAIGGSAKGLGAAGIDQEQELARCMAIVNKTKDTHSIIVVHIGGKARRGALSDGFIKQITPFADYIIVLKGGDDDGLFTNIASSGKIPMEIIGVITESGAALKKAFK